MSTNDTFILYNGKFSLATSSCYCNFKLYSNINFNKQNVCKNFSPFDKIVTTHKLTFDENEQLEFELIQIKPTKNL